MHAFQIIAEQGPGLAAQRAADAEDEAMARALGVLKKGGR
jgi:hypothetical protein